MGIENIFFFLFWLIFRSYLPVSINYLFPTRISFDSISCFILSVVRAPRQYEEIDKDFEQDKANAKESNNSRLSQKVAYPSSFLKSRYPGDECVYLI